MTDHDRDLAALFDPNAVPEEMPVVAPGTLPPSWTAARPAVPATPTPPVSLDKDTTADAHSVNEDRPEPEPTARWWRRRRRADAQPATSELDRQVEEARARRGRGRTTERLQLVGTTGHITHTRRASTAWFVQPPGPWNMRPLPRQRRYIRDEALVLADLAALGVTSLHRRVVRTPWPVRQWAQAHDQWATPIPDVAGALSWADYLRGQQHAMLWDTPTLKGRFWGIELPERSTAGRVLDTVASRCAFARRWPILGHGVAVLHRWAHQTALRERDALSDHLAALERVMAGRGVRARPATEAQRDYLLRRSATLGLPLEVDGAIAGGGDWDEPDIPALEDVTDVTATPAAGYITVRGVIDGALHTGAVIVLTVGRMGRLPIPEQMLPWQVLGDPSGEPLEWSERITLVPQARMLARMHRQGNKIRSQWEHYTVEHDETPPQELTDQYALAQQVKSDVEEDHSGLSTRTEGWYRLAVVGATPEEARRKAAVLQEMFSPHISLEIEHGQYRLFREFMPGEPLANDAHKRHMHVYALSSGMAAVGDRIGDRTGVVIGQTASIAPRPAVWDLFAAHERKHKSGLTPIVAVPGSGKTFLAGMIVYQAVRAGSYAVILDPSGPLRELVNLPEFAEVAEVYALTGRSSRPGSLNPFRVIVDPHRDDPEYRADHPDFRRDTDPVAAAQAQYEADVRAAAAERISVAVSVLKMMLPPARLDLEWTDSVLHTAATRVGGQRHHNLREVLDAIAEIADGDEDVAVRTCARSIHQDLDIMSRLAEARVLFPEAGAGAEAADFDADVRLTVLTMPGLQLPPEGVDPSQWSPQQRMTGPLMHMAAWLANRLVYEKPRHVRKVLFLDENKYLESTGAGKTLNLRISRDSRKYNVRALVCSQLPDDYLGTDGTDDKSALAYEVIVGDLGGNTHAIEGALKLLNLPLGHGYEALLAHLGGGGDDTLDEDTDTSYQDHARRFVVKMADDIELIRSDWTHFVHLAHVFAALNSAATSTADRARTAPW